MYKVYKLSSPKTSKVYIGVTKNLKKRLISHKSVFKKQTEPFHKALKDEGLTLEDFNISLLTEIEDRKTAYKKETQFIKAFYPEVYNYTGANGVSEEHRESMCKAQKGLRKHTVLARSKMSKARLGKPSPMKGKKHTPEAKEKMRLSTLGQPSPHKGKKQSELFGGKSNGFKKGFIPWNKGLKGIPTVTKGSISVNNGITHKRIRPEELDTYLTNGYKRGMLPRVKN